MQKYTIRLTKDQVNEEEFKISIPRTRTHLLRFVDMFPIIQRFLGFTG